MDNFRASKIKLVQKIPRAGNLICHKEKAFQRVLYYSFAVYTSVSMETTRRRLILEKTCCQFKETLWSPPSFSIFKNHKTA